MNTELTGIIFAVAAGLFTEMFFRLIKYRDSLNQKEPQPIIYNQTTEDCSYMSVSQYLSGGSRHWPNYFLFRLLPPTMIFILLSSVIDKYLNIPNVTPYILLAGTVSLVLRDIPRFFTANYVSEKLLHVTNVILVIALAFLVSLLNSKLNFAEIAPTIQGVVDNSWSDLFIAAIVVLYLRATNMNTYQQNDNTKEDVALSNYVVKSYTLIRDKYNTTIQHACAKYGCSPQILYSILIYENMNRPAGLRRLENLIVQTFHLKLTVGIAQIRSDKPLTDKESIERAAKILSGSVYADSGYGDGFDNIQQLEDILRNYNSSKLYSESISQIIVKLRAYAKEIFLG